MSQLRDQLKASLMQAMKDSNEARKSILRVAIGEIDTIQSRQGNISDDEIIRVLRKIVSNNNETIQQNPSPEQIAQLQQENTILGEFLPVQATQEAIFTFLIREGSTAKTDIGAAKSDGAATGVAMKAIKAAGILADGKDVAAVVQKIRTQPAA